MSLKKKTFNITSAQSELLSLTDNILKLADSEDLRPKVKELISALHILRELGISIIPSETKISARERILIYFKQYPLTIIDSEELLIISGITDYQRRIRELRVEFGWPIVGGATARAMYSTGDWPESSINVSKMKPDEYLMLNIGQNREAANSWKTINSLRKQDISVKDKLLQLFRNNIGREITGEELKYLAKDAKEWARRIRELRTEEGWPIKTKNTGRPDMDVGVYVLEEDRQAEEHDRKIDDTTRVAVLERDKFSCCKCGWNYSRIQKGDPRQFLELHHLDYHSKKGSNTVDNLITICNVHHDQIHKTRMSKKQVLEWLKI